MDSPLSVRDLVGREAELGHLSAALDALGAGGAACIAVEGEPGIGKTRLLRELRMRAEERGHLVLAGAAAEFERELPFGVWVDALDAYVASQDLSGREGWDPELAAELGQVLPSVRPGAAGGAIADERFRAHRAMRRLLALLAEAQPVVLVLDDLHWSDSASIELLAALIRRGPPGVLLGLGFRPGQAAAGLTAALAAPGVERLQLGPISELEAGLLLDGHDAETVAAIWRRGGGNPFYLEQLSRSSAGTETPTGEVAGLPAAVTGAIGSELGSLAPESRAFLDSAAVAGEPFEPDVAAAVAGLDEDAGLTALDDLLGLDLVRPTQVPRRFAFRHPLVRAAVYESTGGGWRLGAHRRAAAALADRGAAAAERAHHVEMSARQGDEDAIACLLEAGDAAASRAPAAAARWFEAALRLLPAGATERQVEVRVALASALRAVGELERCRATLLEAIELLPEDAADRRVELTTLCAAVEHWRGLHTDAHKRLLRAWDELADTSTPAAAALQIELAVDGLYAVDLEQGLAMGEGALATSRALGDPALVAAAAAALGLVSATGGDLQRAAGHRTEAAEQVERLTDEELAPRLEALFYLGWTETYLELYDDSIAHAQRGIAIARATGQGRLLVPLMLVQGFPFQMQGRLAECLEMAEAAVEAARLSANPHSLYWALFELGWAHYFAGDLDAAIAAAEESLSVDSRLLGGTMPSAGGGPGWLRGCARLEAGDPQFALDAMREIARADLNVAVQRNFDLEVIALAEIALGDLEGARRSAERAGEYAEGLGTRLAACVAGRTRAAVLLADGDPLGAATAGEQAAAAADAIGAHLQRAFAQVLQGRGLAAAGERERAVAVLRDAERTLDECGSLRVRDEARRELRKLGARAEPRGPAASEEAGIGSLSKRELEIAELIAERLTNQQIADRLFLSKKTVESHIRNLFFKLGAASRVEVARIVERSRD
ncbi:MAG TPA: BREX system ATP-binding domain-containing protein [Thermoleophilaceae bacterium]